MPEPEALETIRAAVDTVVPATDELAGGVAMGVQDHVTALLEIALPGMTDMVAALLNAYAMDVRPGATFVDLTAEERSNVLRNMSSDDSQDIRDAVDAIIVFSMGGTCSEWSGYERATGSLKPPASWSLAGFPGPSLGHADYREDV